MVRPKRCLPVGYPVHVIQRGNNRQPCFRSGGDKAVYVSWLTETAVSCGLDVHAWVLMTNHVHLLVTPRQENAVSRVMQHLGRRYVPYFNARVGRTGTLFEGRFRSTVVESDAYFLACQRYIELNPVRAGTVLDPGAFEWSSFRAHAFGVRPQLWTPHERYLALAPTKELRMAAYQRLFDEALPEDFVDALRSSTTSGLPLGGEQFCDELEALTGVRQRRLPLGPLPRRQGGELGSSADSDPA